MGNDVEVTHGGVVAVDTGQLWTAAAVVAAHTRTMHELITEVTCVRRELWPVTDSLDADVDRHARGAQWFAQTAAEGLSHLGRNLARSAEEYEEAELRVSWQFARLQHDGAALAGIEARAIALGIDVETLGEESSRFGERASAWWAMAVQYVLPLLQGGGPFSSANALTAGAALTAMMVLITRLDRGTIATGTTTPGTIATTGTLGGLAKPVVVTASGPVSGRPPTSLAALAGRIPNSTAQVSIERFAMPGGRTEWAVYVAGTRSSEMGGAEPWDMQSNTELYLGERSASSDAVLVAMRAAGVEPGQPVHLVGHSQGGMIAANVAMSGDFEVASLTTFGSPVDAEVPESVLSVRVRHDDDPVAALAGIGSAVGGGSPDSVVISRTGDARLGLHDLGLAMHGLEAYAHTAELYQSSGDVRVAAVDRLFAHLGTADAVTRTEYVAVRAAAEPGPGRRG